MNQDQLVATLKRVSTATLTMQLLKRGIRQVWMFGPKPLSDGQERIAGPAFTLRFIPGREDLSGPEILKRTDLAQRRAIEECPPGHILVVDCLGLADGAAIGDILATRMQVRGVAGMVSDACVRDADGVKASGLPVWCPGAAAPASVASLSDGDLNVPIGCGGVAVIPGDWVVCDNDGVVVIPQALVQEVAEGGLEQELHEQFILQQVKDGAKIPGTYPPNADNLAKYQEWKAKTGG
ncbi:MAG: ribonuclease activity regulator RraA [Alphaproteobacteria bacterium]|nr:ribonuclease activity regulator RraA [Alphaproteobacteria bacterium]MCB9946220.1 ribonuclease activity regulator RraA [Rhodospirillaceae bacterium]